MACIWWWRRRRWWRKREHWNITRNRYVYIYVWNVPYGLRHILSPRLPSTIWCQSHGYFSFRFALFFLLTTFILFFFLFPLKHFALQRITVGCRTKWVLRKCKKRIFTIRQLEQLFDERREEKKKRSRRENAFKTLFENNTKFRYIETDATC